MAHNLIPHFIVYTEDAIFQFEHFFLETPAVTPGMHCQSRR